MLIQISPDTVWTWYNNFFFIAIKGIRKLLTRDVSLTAVAVDLKFPWKISEKQIQRNFRFRKITNFAIPAVLSS